MAESSLTYALTYPGDERPDILRTPASVENIGVVQGR